MRHSQVKKLSQRLVALLAISSSLACGEDGGPEVIPDVTGTYSVNYLFVYDSPGVTVDFTCVGRLVILTQTEGSFSGVYEMLVQGDCAAAAQTGEMTGTVDVNGGVTIEGMLVADFGLLQNQQCELFDGTIPVAGRIVSERIDAGASTPVECFPTPEAKVVFDFEFLMAGPRSGNVPAL